MGPGNNHRALESIQQRAVRAIPSRLLFHRRSIALVVWLPFHRFGLDVLSIDSTLDRLVLLGRRV